MGASEGRRKLAPIQKFRAKYSDGFMAMPAATSPKNSDSAESGRVMRRWNQSRVSRPRGSQAMPCSVSTTRRSGKRSSTPP